jgi:hypothetical protein
MFYNLIAFILCPISIAINAIFMFADYFFGVFITNGSQLMLMPWEVLILIYDEYRNEDE